MRPGFQRVRQRIDEFATAAAFAADQFGPPESAWERLAAAAFHPVAHPRDSAPGQDPHRRFATWVVVGLSAAACLAGVALHVVLVTRDGGSSPTTPLAVTAYQARHQAGAHSVTLIARDGRVAASVVVLPSGAGYLISHLAPIAAGRTYQLWATDDSAGMISLGFLGGHPAVVAFSVVGGADAS